MGYDHPDSAAIQWFTAGARDRAWAPQRDRVAERIHIGIPAAFGLSALSGILYAASFPPLSCTALAWVALVPLLVGCASLSPLRAAVAGMCWTATMGVDLGWFLPSMLSSYFGVARVPGLFAAIAIVIALHGTYVSAFAAWVAWLARRRAAHPILIAAGWMVCEFARTQAPLGSPWALTAYSQMPNARLIQIADLAGPYGIGMLVAAINAAVAALLVPRMRGRRPRLSAIAIATGLAGAFVYGEWRLTQSFDAGAPVRVAVVQGGAPPADKALRAARLQRYETLTLQRADARADLLVWPEYATEAYLNEASSTRERLLRLSTATGANFVLGGPHYTAAATATRYHNSIYLLRDGGVAGRYDKHRLVPIAEDDTLEWLVGRKATTYTAGSGSFLLPGRGLHLGALLCIESMYPDLVRQAVGQGADLLVNLSNDAWFGHVEPARHQLDIATLRAVENRRYVVRAASTGFSAVIDPHGRTLTRSGFDTHQVLNATVHAAHVRTPYQRWGDSLAWVVFAAVALVSLRLLVTRNQHPDRRRSMQMNSRMLATLALSVAVGFAATAHAGAPQPDQRQGDFEHVCKGGENKGQTCTVPTQDTDCPGSECIPLAVSKRIKGKLTLIAHDSVTDWLNGVAANRALTVMLEVKAPDGSKQLIAATYQNVASPADPPQAPSNVVAIDMDEAAVKTLSAAVNGLLFAQPESAIVEQLQTLFNVTGTPAIVGVKDKQVQITDQTTGDLATVLRFKVQIQFLNAL